MPTPKKNPAQAEPEFVTKTEFDKLQESIIALTGIVAQSIQASKDATDAVATAKALVPETPVEKEIKKAGPNFMQNVNQEWQDMAQLHIGEALDHVEVEMPRSGGTLFTIVIKPEFSNAPDMYMQLHKIDRRTKEIGAEGIGGVENWCKIVAQNLKKPKSITPAN